MLTVNDQIRIPLDEFQWTFVRSGGPGGQNVNKVASKAVLRWPLDASPSVPDAVKARLRGHHAKRVTAEGELVLSSQRYRDQERNREDCLEKLAEMLRAAATVPKVRRPTKPTRSSKRRRVAAKRLHSAAKARRKSPAEE
jgi:ribosome-associated protein